MTRPLSPSDDFGAPAGARRLESWKEIAAYLKRTVRTVHRWEKNEGLPVHRHLHRTQGSVYAYTTELDAWWRDRTVPAEPTLQKWPARRLVAVAALVLAAIVGLVVYLSPASFAPDSPGGTRLPDSIAVLPFQALDVEGEDKLLALGVAEEVRVRLSDVRALTVIARTSAFAFGGPPLDPVEIADRLGVEYLLDGSLQREGNVLRVRARLLDAKGRQLWSKTYDRPAQGLFEVQDEIAAAVVASLAPQLERLRTPANRPHGDAYQYYLLGREHLSLWAIDDAAAAFQKATELDPAFSRPYGGLAMVRALQSGLVEGGVSLGEAREAAEYALSLDPELADAHAALGRIAHAAGQLAEAEASLKRALELDPDLGDARLWLSANLLEQGRFAESERALEQALAIDPLHAELNAQLASLHWSRGDFEGSRRPYLRILNLPDPPLWAYQQLVLLHRDFGRLGEALEWAKRGALAETSKWVKRDAVASTGGDPVLYLDGLVLSYNRLGMVGEVRRWLQRLNAVQGRPWIGVNSEFLYTLGRFEEVHMLNMEHLRNAGRPLQELPFVMQAIVGGFYVLTGRHEEGIAVLGPLYSDTFRIPEGLPSPGHAGDFELMFAQFLAYGYRKVGRDEEAERLLGRIDSHVQNLRQAGLGGWPNLYIVEARNHALRGEKAAALAALRQAVNTGWRDYVFERHNPCWDALREDAEYKSLIALVAADVAAQRQRVEARGRDEQFEARMLAMLGR